MLDTSQRTARQTELKSPENDEFEIQRISADSSRLNPSSHSMRTLVFGARNCDVILPFDMVRLVHLIA